MNPGRRIPPTSLADVLYARVANRKPFFYDGWGNTFALEYLLNIKNPSELYGRVPAAVQFEQMSSRRVQGTLVQKMTFASPYFFVRHHRGRTMTSWLPPEASQVACLFVFPRQFSGGPVAIHFAATGDEGQERRLRWLALPLAREGIASVILEHPMYGQRRLLGCDSRPARVTDFLMMSRAAQDEGIGVARHLQNCGYGPIVFTGISMGGYMALAACARSGLVAAVAACIPSHSAGPVYTEGVLSRSVHWAALGRGLGPWAEAVCRNLPGGVAADPRPAARAVLTRLLALGDIDNLPRVKRPHAIAVVNARRDAYIPPASREAIHACYPEASYQEVDRGHVGAFLFGADTFRRAIHAALARL